MELGWTWHIEGCHTSLFNVESSRLFEIFKKSIFFPKKMTVLTWLFTRCLWRFSLTATCKFACNSRQFSLQFTACEITCKSHIVFAENLPAIKCTASKPHVGLNYMQDARKIACSFHVNLRAVFEVQVAHPDFFGMSYFAKHLVSGLKLQYLLCSSQRVCLFIKKFRVKMTHNSYISMLFRSDEVLQQLKRKL